MSAMFWNMIYTQQPDNKEIANYINEDDLTALLRSDRLKTELQQPSQELSNYLSSTKTLKALIQNLASEDTQLSAAANEIFVSDIAEVSDALTNSEELLQSLFELILPFSADDMRYVTVEELQKMPVHERRVPLCTAENFCRAIYTLISKNQRKIRVLLFLSENLETLTWFAKSIESAPVTETLHYIFKIDQEIGEAADLQARIVLESHFIQQLYTLFLENSAFEELVHVAFVFQSFLQSEIAPAVRKEIMRCLPGVLSSALSEASSPAAVKNLFTVAAVTLKFAVRGGVLAEQRNEAAEYVKIIEDIMRELVLKLRLFLSFEIEKNSCNESNLLAIHACTVVSEIFKIEESVFEAVKDKEEMLLNRQFKPEEAILYMTQYYKSGGEDVILPFVVGFSYIFEDIYQHLQEQTKFKFDEGFTKQVTMTQAGVKKAITAHLFGPNGELCVGSVEYIIANLINEGIVNLIFRESVANIENSIIHYTMSQVLTILADYAAYNVPFAIEFLLKQNVFAGFKQRVTGNMQQEVVELIVNGQAVQNEDARAEDGVEFEEAKKRIVCETKRTSFDSLIVEFLRKLGSLRQADAIQKLLADTSCAWLSQLYEVKEAIGM